MVIVLMCSAAVMVAMRVQIPMPAQLSRGLQHLAGLTMFVYLLHIIVIFVVSDYGLIPLPDVPRVIVSIILSFAVAAAAKHFFERFEPRLRARLQRSSGRLRPESEGAA
jgi:peptidoglycan/LPS O-acetylase OafA/YrhL